MSDDPIKTTETQQNSLKESRTPLRGKLLDRLMPVQQNPSTSPIESESSYIPGQSSMGFLRFFAWVDLIASIIGAIWVWHVYGSIATDIYFTELNPIGIATGIGILFQGILVFTVFYAIAAIDENVIAIRKKMGT